MCRRCTVGPGWDRPIDQSEDRHPHPSKCGHVAVHRRPWTGVLHTTLQVMSEWSVAGEQAEDEESCAPADEPKTDVLHLRHADLLTPHRGRIGCYRSPASSALSTARVRSRTPIFARILDT